MSRARLLLLTLSLICTVSPSLAGTLATFPELHASVVLDAISTEDDKAMSPTTFFPGTDRFAIREAALEAVGRYGEQVDYIVKGGTATCLGNTTFQLLEASVMMRLGHGWRVGFEKSHVLRGFINFEECTDQLVAEKPNFSTILAPCHPTGFKADWQGELGTWPLRAQLALLNGADGSLEDEHDYNLGLYLNPPVRGLTLSGYYNDVAFLTGEWSPQGTATSADGHRWGLGARYHTRRLELQGELFGAKGFPMAITGPAPAELLADDRTDFYANHQMNFAYIQAGYHIPTHGESVPEVVPYIRYQSWNRNSQADGDHTSAYITYGLLLPLAAENALFRLDYERPVETPKGLAQEAARMIARVQITI